MSNEKITDEVCKFIDKALDDTLAELKKNSKEATPPATTTIVRNQSAILVVLKTITKLLRRIMAHAEKCPVCEGEGKVEEEIRHQTRLSVFLPGIIHPNTNPYNTNIYTTRAKPPI